MTETYTQQRERILNDCDTPAETFDLFVALGYEPESWYGLWKLPTKPIVFRALGLVVYREIVYRPGTTDAIYRRNWTAKTRLRIRRHPLR